MTITINGSGTITGVSTLTTALVNPVVTTTIGVGNATPSASGAGVTFPATQSASSDANTLDDYEEGAWTPTFSSSAGSITSYTSAGDYIKIGRMVYLWGAIRVTNIGTASGAGVWGGAPFTSIPNFVTSGNRTAVFTVREDGNTGTVYQGYLNTSNTNGNFLSLTNAGIAWANGDVWEFSFGYETT